MRSLLLIPIRYMYIVVVDLQNDVLWEKMDKSGYFFPTVHHFGDQNHIPYRFFDLSVKTWD